MARLPEISNSQVISLRRRLLRWYGKQRRALPWRSSRDSYRVWVAEVMLQQTRIAVVIPAYQRFIAAFPDLRRLAAAAEDEVLSLWSGLGYYSRARALQRAARQLVEQGADEFPADYKTARRLPGVGPYTAAAVLSIAYDQPYAAVDGNVIRVLSRLFCQSLPDARGEPYASLAQRLLDPVHAGDWNQAVMELGETVCTPQVPCCADCPWRFACRAYATAAVDRYPPPRARRPREQVRLEMQIVRDRAGRLLLEQDVFPFLPHLWLPPVRMAGQAGRTLPGKPLGEIRHAIVHRDFRVQVQELIVSPSRLEQLAQRKASGRRAVFTPQEVIRIGRSSLLSKALKLVGAKA